MFEKVGMMKDAAELLCEILRVTSQSGYLGFCCSYTDLMCFVLTCYIQD